MAAGVAGQVSAALASAAAAPKFKISLAEWSLHKMLNGGKLNNLEI